MSVTSSPAPAAAPRHIDLDVAIIGGGIAGLWLANRLTKAGFSSAVFEQTALGSDQSVASQGMIHGGVKYALSGALTGASEAIADMPAHWQACLRGEGDVDLRGAKVLSEHFYMWSSQSVASKVTTFFASKALRGRVDAIKPDDYPSLFKAAKRKFSIYKLLDLVLDVPSVVSALANNIAGKACLIDWQQSRWVKRDNSLALQIGEGDNTVEVRANRFVFTAGKGNGELLAAAGCAKPEMQLRPLQQVMVKHQLGHSFFGHCLGADKTPRLTISSHIAEDGDTVWYLGGALAEKGVNLSADDLIAKAKAELQDLMPWLDLSAAQWATLPVQRAEPKQLNFARPDQAFAARASGVDNLYVGWPTKLTLAPNMSEAMLALLTADGIAPQYPQPPLDFLPAAPIARSPWDILFSNHGDA